MSNFDDEREANIARNKALLAQLDISMSNLGIPTPAEKAKSKAKPVQPAKRVKRERGTGTPLPARETRSSTRQKRPVINPNETPAQKKKREKEEEEARRKEEEERLEAEEREREAKRPRHQDLDLDTLGEELDDSQIATLRANFELVLKTVHPRREGDPDRFTFDDDGVDQEAEVVSDLRKRLGKMKVVARAKVCTDRIYSAAYHPEPTKDLIFFGDKHGQLGIWDARAPSDAVDDDHPKSKDTKEDGKYWRLQAHWPATSRSSISSVKFDPRDAHSVFTSAYDRTIRTLSFTSGISREIFSTSDERILIHSIDLPPTGNEMWISDSGGSLTHLDLREDKSKARYYGVSTQKVGSVSINPANPNFLLTASNNRFLRIWDARNLDLLKTLDDEENIQVIEDFLTKSEDGSSCLKSSWEHGKAINSAYWDPRGRSIVSTCYDDKLRFWDVDPSFMTRPSRFPTSRPKNDVSHDCQTGRWLTVFKAQWSPNPDVYPHITVGNMLHSLDIYSCKGELLASLSDPSRITAVQAVTCSHPSVVERAASGNGSGRCVLWAPVDS
ncbi:WD40 repeat-like protein [Cristinia sonorae]|uniref:DNA damage-binding protein CMR1 n=1 Tax=Cristinia sonorae TaxID=1940300 RepID=A0A8K0UXW5_9AGAR|nr:WD40 repeat-like protein [Cristinia sonorae]